MSDNKAVAGVLNAILCGSTIFGFIKIAPAEHPYAFTACVIGFCHGLCGLIKVAVGDNETAKSVLEATTNIMDLIPLPLVNLDIYLKGESNNIALGHGLFIVPLAVDMIISLIKDKGEESTGPTLRTLTLLGSITSMVYLAINESSWIYGGIAISAYMARFGADYLDEKIDNSKVPINLLSYSCFYVLTTLAISGEK